MFQTLYKSDNKSSLPEWVPNGVRSYLAHTEGGWSIRKLARHHGLHASTILRQIRKMEIRRDDPLIDAALHNLGQSFNHAQASNQDSRILKMSDTVSLTRNNSDDISFRQDAMRVLLRLVETGAILAIAPNMDKAIVVRENAQGASQRTAVVERPLAEALALKEWISVRQAGRITRYEISSAGRSALDDMTKTLSPAAGFAEAPATFHGAQLVTPDEPRRRPRYGQVESPLTALARRRDKDGSAFLNDTLVAAGERLREDFELANMSPGVTQNWDRFLDGGARSTAPHAASTGPEAARARVLAALSHLGPGLSDITLRCCCYLEGLEVTEKELGWSARSGKIVLRIALIRLKRHYDETYGPGGGMIG